MLHVTKSTGPEGSVRHYLNIHPVISKMGGILKLQYFSIRNAITVANFHRQCFTCAHCRRPIDQES